MHSKLSEQVEAYLTTLGRSKLTVATYRSALRDFVFVSGENAELNKDTYIKFLKSLKRHSPATQRVKKAAVRGLYRYHESPAYALLEAADEHHLKRMGSNVITYDELAVEKFVEYCKSLHGDIVALRDKAFVITLGDTGLRISEACALRRGDLDITNRRAFVLGKGDKKAIVRFNAVSIMAIKAYHEARKDGGSGKALKSLPVFSSHKSKTDVLRVTPNGMRKAFNQRIQEAGVEVGSVTPHTLRHWFVTNALRGSNNLELARKLARHSNVSVTQRYSHLSDEEVEQAYRDIFDRTNDHPAPLPASAGISLL